MPGITAGAATTGLRNTNGSTGSHRGKGLQRQDKSEQNDSHRFQCSCHACSSLPYKLPDFRARRNQNFVSGPSQPLVRAGKTSVALSF